MITVDHVFQEQMLMLNCPKCKWRFPVKLPAFCLATHEGRFIACAACGSEFTVSVELLDRVVEQRDEAVGEGAEESPKTLRTKE